MSKCFRCAIYTVLALCFLLGGASATTDDNPYYDESSYVSKTDVFVKATIKFKGKSITFQDVTPFVQNNIFYVPLRQTLNSCGIDDAAIVWNDGVITVSLGKDTLCLAINSDEWTLNNAAPYRTYCGHAQAVDGVTFVPKEMMDEWRNQVADSPLGSLAITTYYSPHAGGKGSIAY